MQPLTSLLRRVVTRTGLVLFLQSTLVISTVSPEVHAQSQDDLDRARNQFRQGLSLEAAGNWAAALGKFQEVSRVKLTPQVRFHIARCKENLGRLNEALGDYRLAEYEAQQQGLQELEAIAEAREQLEARVPTVRIVRGEGAEVARISLDGVELGESQLAQPVSVDPGPHTVVAKLPGDAEFQETIVVQERERKELTLTPPADVLAQSRRSGASTGEGAAAATGDPRADEGKGDAGVLPWVIGGVGVAGLAASGVFFVLRNGAESDLEDGCRGSVCPKSLEDTQDKGELYATLSTLSLGVGVVGVGIATYLLVTSGGGDASREGRTAEPKVAFDVRVGARQGGASIRGTF